MEEIGLRIREIRKILGMTQQEFADELKLTRNYIYMIESGKALPSEKVLEMISVKYGVAYMYLTDGIGVPFAPKTVEEEVSEIASSILNEDNQFRRQLISTISKLSQDELDVLQKICEDALDGLKKGE